MLYLDTARRDDLDRLLATGLFAGVTTNPTILDRAGLAAIDIAGLRALVREHGELTFFAQATGADLDGLRATSSAIAEAGDDIVIKIVATAAGLTVARELVEQGREVLVTAVYHPGQMLLARAAGAAWIAPYVGRASDAGRDGIELVRGLAAARGADGPRILAASLRSPDQAADAIAAGATDLTLSAALADALLSDELTVRAAHDFDTLAASSAARPAPTTPSTAERGGLG